MLTCSSLRDKGAEMSEDAMARSTSGPAALTDWLVQQGIEGATQQELLGGYCDRLVELGVPLMRLQVAQSAFHPRYGGIGLEWRRGAGIDTETFAYSEEPSEQWVRSPFYHMLTNQQVEMHMRLDGADADRFPVFSDLRADGGTDYFAAATVLARSDPSVPLDPANPPEGVAMSWTTDAPEGFGSDHLDLIRSAQPYLTLAMKSASNRLMAEQLVRVYLGRDAGRRVLSGELQRGSLREIDAVMCYFDLNGFTAMAERLPGSDLIAMLNDYFGIAVGEIQKNGGHILKFMGDGLLAMFGHEDMNTAADAALDTAVALRWCMDGRNCDRRAAGLPHTQATLALHAGRILYGNIGAENRLDFTAIGPAVNLTARLSGMHHAIGQDLILSDEVARLATAGRHDMVSLGRYMLRGVSEPRELFTVYETRGG